MKAKILKLIARIVGFVNRNLLIGIPAIRFIRHNKKLFKQWTVDDPASIVLIDKFVLPEWIIAVSYFANILAKSTNSKIATFSERREFDILGFYKSFNVKLHIHVNLDDRARKAIEVDHIIQTSREKIKTNRDLLEFKYHEVEIGVDIYESYLKRGHSTVVLENEELWVVFEYGIRTLLFWEEYFKNQNVAAVIVSHDCYVNMNILAKVAYKHKVPVYLPNARGLNLSTSPYSIYFNRFSRFREEFQKLSVTDQEASRKWASERLNKRLSGTVGVDMRYSTKSAFSGKINSRIMKNTDRLKIVIASHCFYDNPHSYGRILFNDFHEWLMFLVEMAGETNYDWYIKPHPDYLPGTIETIESIIQHSTITLINPAATWNQLVDEGLNWVVTCYGTVGHELPLLGVKVLNCGYNPHIHYKFNVNPTSISEYRNIIRDLPSYNYLIDKEEIYEFYYMNYRACFIDDLIFDSYEQLYSEINAGEEYLPSIYTRYMESFNEDRAKKTIEYMVEFLQSNQNNYFKCKPGELLKTPT